MTITVYSKTGCVQCTATYRALDKHGLSYEVVDIETNPAALIYIEGLGYRQAPVVITATEHWSGFRPDKIESLTKSPTQQ